MIIEYPLTKANRIQLARAFRNVPRVDLSIECVIEGQMGKAHVDHIPSPSAYKIRAGPFFYYAGEASGEGGQDMLRNIQPWTLFMPSSEGWVAAGKSMYGERLIAFDRYSFSSECLSVEHLEKLSHESEFGKNIKQIDLALATQVWGQDHSLDISDFESASDFIERGIGYYMEKNGKILGCAYSSLVCSKGIEVSIFVSEEYRRLGIATTLAAHLLKWCLENHMDPHWDAANPESCTLARKLGYLPKGTYEAYFLKS
jgi:GNAT superfamily N-acetyltransferase